MSASDRPCSGPEAAVATAFSYRGSLQVINQIAPPDRRAEIVSAYLLCGFAGNSIPVIGVGALSRIMTLLHASMVFAGVIALLSLAGLVISKRAGRDLTASTACTLGGWPSMAPSPADTTR